MTIVPVNYQLWLWRPDLLWSAQKSCAGQSPAKIQSVKPSHFICLRLRPFKMTYPFDGSTSLLYPFVFLMPPPLRFLLQALKVISPFQVLLMSNIQDHQVLLVLKLQVVILGSMGFNLWTAKILLSSTQSCPERFLWTLWFVLWAARSYTGRSNVSWPLTKTHLCHPA